MKTLLERTIPVDSVRTALQRHDAPPRAASSTCDVAQALAVPGQFNGQRRWSACVAIVTSGEAPDRLEYIEDTDDVGVAHRSSTPRRKAVAGQIDDINIRRFAR